MSFFEIWIVGALAAWLYMTAAWVLSVILKNASIVDIFWGLGFVLLAGVYFALTEDGYLGRRLVLGALVLVWGVRLSGYILVRNWGEGEDYRYQQFRQEYGPERYWWFSYFQVFLLQGAIMWFISSTFLAAMYHAEPDYLTVLDVLAAMLWTIGFFFEAVGDWHLWRFKSNPANKGQVLDRGVWSYTRHPNYFGDAAQWWAYGLFAAVTGWGLLTLVGPLLMTFLLLRVSGVAMLERNLTETKPQYADYIRRTNAFFPGLPREIEPSGESEPETGASAP
jgi:steroid 5-alpha reductase family enzyme